MAKTNFEKSSLLNVDFTEADLSQTNFSGCNLAETTFANTNLSQADFREAENFQIDPNENVLMGALFSRNSIEGLLNGFGISIEG